MKGRQIHTFLFSPTGRTVRAARALVDRLGSRLGLPVVISDYTLPANRECIKPIEQDELVVWASPVYAGRTPNLLLSFVREVMRGDGNPVVLLATFGNRSFDNALAEMAAVVRAGGMRPVAAAAVVAQHAFAPDLGLGRPNTQDLDELRLFADNVEFSDEIRFLPGNADAPYYQPMRQDMTPARFLKALPEWNANACILCRKCASLCPAGAISISDAVHFSSPCIKCMACVNGCPTEAISIKDADFLSHRAMLTEHYQTPAENVFIV